MASKMTTRRAKLELDCGIIERSLQKLGFRDTPPFKGKAVDEEVAWLCFMTDQLIQLIRQQEDEAQEVVEGLVEEVEAGQAVIDYSIAHLDPARNMLGQ